MDRSLLYRLAMLAAVLVVLLNTWVAARSLTTLLRAQFWLSHTLEVLAQTESLAVQNRSADADVRGFLLTGDAKFERLYDGVDGNLRAGVDHLQTLVKDNPQETERLRLLRSAIEGKLLHLDAAIAARRVQGGPDLPPAILANALADTPDKVDGVQSGIAAMEREEQRLLVERTATAKSARQQLVVMFILAAVLSLVLMVVAFEFLVRTAQARAALAHRTEQVVALNRDLAEANATLEERVAERTRELEASNQELEAFSYSVSHDLRAPLRTIDGFSLAIKEDYGNCLDAQGLDYIERVRGGVQRMGQLIDALLQLSRVTRSELQRTPVDLSQLATMVFQELQATEPQRRVAFTAQPGVIVEGDARLLRIALENLIGNAWKFTSKTEDARIEFGSGSEQGETLYFIRDNGAGFEMQYVHRLFTAFQRLHGDREFKGSGIGLATVSRIVRRHHGTIRAESEPGHGATFSFTLGPQPGAASSHIPEDAASLS